MPSTSAHGTCPQDVYAWQDVTRLWWKLTKALRTVSLQHQGSTTSLSCALRTVDPPLPPIAGALPRLFLQYANVKRRTR